MWMLLLILVWPACAVASKPVAVGVIHSMTGTMAESERPLVDALRLAAEEINSSGGVLGRPLKLVVRDGRSDPEVSAIEAERMINKEGVKVLLGCWTSACRIALRPVVERYNHLLIYPVQYEGLEQSPNILYTGATPNQQIIPAVRWAMERFGNRVWLTGSDYIFPRTANRIIRDLVSVSSGHVLGENLHPLGSNQFRSEMEAIRREQPDIIFNTLNGDSNHAFFDAMVEAGLIDQPLISFSVSEQELSIWGGGRLERHYGAWSYFQSLNNLRNHRFVSAFKRRFGDERVTSDPIEASYIGLHLWAATVNTENSVEPARINRAIVRQTLASPSSIAAVDSVSRHLWKRVRIGRVLANGQYEQLYASDGLVRPAPWPVYRNHNDWNQRINQQGER